MDLVGCKTFLQSNGGPVLESRVVAARETGLVKRHLEVGGGAFAPSVASLRLPVSAIGTASSGGSDDAASASAVARRAVHGSDRGTAFLVSVIIRHVSAAVSERRKVWFVDDEDGEDPFGVGIARNGSPSDHPLLAIPTRPGVRRRPESHWPRLMVSSPRLQRRASRKWKVTAHSHTAMVNVTTRA